MKNPFKRHEFRPVVATIEARPLCGCGLSRTFPFCDGTQMIANTHHADQLVRCGGAKQEAQPDRELQAS